jgi:hypothetical protein
MTAIPLGKYLGKRLGDPPKGGTERWTPVGNFGNFLAF